MNLGYAAAYDVKNPKMWSGTPYSLYRALETCGRLETLTDIDLSKHISEKDKKINQYKNLDLPATLKSRQFTAKAGAAVNNIVNSRALNSVLPGLNMDALLQIGGFKIDKPHLPYFVYSDATHDMTLDYYKKYGSLPFQFRSLTPDCFERASKQVHSIYENAAGIFCMSRWMADSLINTTGISQEKVHIVYAGPNFHGYENPLPASGKTHTAGSSPVNIAFVGVDYEAKGCGQLVAAVKLLNDSNERRYRLHIAGLKAENIPPDTADNDNIFIHGYLGKASLFKLLGDSDLFVLPSLFDFFGIAFIEAMSFGLPCIGRNICAMPEIIDEGVNGELLKDTDHRSLADLIVKITGNKEIYEEYSRQAIRKSRLFSWDKTANKMLDVICKINETASS